MDLEKHNEESQQILQSDESQQNIEQNTEYVYAEKPKYWKAFFAGLGITVLVAIILALLAIWLEYEFLIAVIIGVGLVGAAIRHFIPKPSISAAFIGAVLCPLCYLLYFGILTMQGYSYAEDADITFWLMLIGSAIYGGYLGFKNSDNVD